jgi:hypothetical protein
MNCSIFIILVQEALEIHHQNLLMHDSGSVCHVQSSTNWGYLTNLQEWMQMLQLHGISKHDVHGFQVIRSMISEGDMLAFPSTGWIITSLQWDDQVSYTFKIN